jgi:hypothetical protein
LRRPPTQAARRLVGRYPLAINATRSFSSSPGNEEPPTFEFGAEFVAAWYRRSVNSLPRLAEYLEKGAFSDSLSVLGKTWLFLQLQFPKKTSVDVLEFLEGARVATEAKLRAMNCVAFPEFLARKENSSSDVADSLQHFTTSEYYTQLALRVKKNYLHRKVYVECEGMAIESAQLAGSVYQRLTEQEYADLVAFRKPPRGLSRNATIEQLQLYVHVATVEDLKIVILEGKTRHVQQQNLYRVIFESRVTEPEHVDWRIASMDILEKNAVERRPETPEDASEGKKGA